MCLQLLDAVWLFFFLDNHRNFGGDFPMQSQSHLVLAKRSDRLIENHLAAIYLEILLLERIGNIFCRNGTEEVVVFANPVAER